MTINPKHPAIGKQMNVNVKIPGLWMEDEMVQIKTNFAYNC
jgi:hypothetical protein